MHLRPVAASAANGMIYIVLFSIAMVASVAYALYDERKKRKKAEAEEDPIWAYARSLGQGARMREIERGKEDG